MKFKNLKIFDQTLKLAWLILIVGIFNGCNLVQDNKVVLFADDFSELTRGPLGANVGAHTEYHYYHEAKPKGNWAISNFGTNLQESWYVRKTDDRKFLYQKGINTSKHWHPIVVAGDEMWENYKVRTSFAPENKEKQSGIVFRYRNDRCYYALVTKQDTVYLKMVRHATAYQEPYEKILAFEPYSYNPGSEIKINIKLYNDQISASIENGPQFHVVDTTYMQGKIAFLADGPTRFYPIEITASNKDILNYEKKRKAVNNEEKALQAKIPKPVLWKKIDTKKFWRWTQSQVW